MNNFKFRYVLPLMVFWFSCPWNYSNSLQAQTASERRNYLSKQIQKTEEILLQSEKEKMTAFKNMQIQITQIANRNELIENTAKELEKLDQSLTKLKSEHHENLNRLEILKEEYFKSLRRKWMQRNTVKANYLFAPHSELNAIIKSWVWYDQLDRERKEKYTQFKKSQELVLEKQNEILKQINIQKELLHSKETEKNKLAEDLKKQQIMISENQTKKQEWLTLIKKYQKEMSKIESIVSSGIKENNLDLSKNKNISTSLKSDWRFPLKEGIVVSTFGTQNDPNNRAVKIKNNGVDIQSKNSFVSAVNNAEVLQIRQLANGTYLVLCKEGNFYQVYSNLDKVLVRAGETLAKGNHIGQCKATPQGRHELHFEVWKGKTPQNPMKFLLTD
ncbi:MAG: peptidoglycan DD-metalloendopeptidase family protein [Saprospiraceae bacterium]|nr:peptidoglycan DD-metalloendopeptidase family protein [Candidatus Vicinibacter proximus]MCC6843738.1 peptidoglycan DD-metalloendopeptidase family protein [Saprospiraceae bacterium]